MRLRTGTCGRTNSHSAISVRNQCCARCAAAALMGALMLRLRATRLNSNALPGITRRAGLF